MNSNRRAGQSIIKEIDRLSEALYVMLRQQQWQRRRIVMRNDFEARMYEPSIPDPLKNPVVQESLQRTLYWEVLLQCRQAGWYLASIGQAGDIRKLDFERHLDDSHIPTAEDLAWMKDDHE